MTGATAQRFKIDDRGFVKEGNFADITVFDYKNIVVNPDLPDFKPQGIKYVFINGQEVMSDGEYISRRAGEALLRK